MTSESRSKDADGLPTVGTGARRGVNPPASAAPRAPEPSSHSERIQASMARLVRERDEARADAECLRQLLAYHGYEVAERGR